MYESDHQMECLVIVFENEMKTKIMLINLRSVDIITSGKFSLDKATAINYREL